MKFCQLHPEAGYRRPQHIDRHASRLTTRQPWVATHVYYVATHVPLVFFLFFFRPRRSQHTYAVKLVFLAGTFTFTHSQYPQRSRVAPSRFEAGQAYDVPSGYSESTYKPPSSDAVGTTGLVVPFHELYRRPTYICRESLNTNR